MTESRRPLLRVRVESRQSPRSQVGHKQPRGLTPEQVEWSGIGPGTVKLSIGIEDAEDLIADLRQALERSGT